MILPMNRAPLVAVLVAMLWLSGTVFQLYALTGTAAVLGLVLPAFWALGRRTAATRRALASGLAATGFVLAAFLVALWPGNPGGTWVFLLELLALSVGALAIPLLYAMTTGSGEGPPR